MFHYTAGYSGQTKKFTASKLRSGISFHYQRDKGNNFAVPSKQKTTYINLHYSHNYVESHYFLENIHE